MIKILNRIIRFWRQKISHSLLPLIPTIAFAGLGLAALALWLFAKIAEEVVEQETQAFDTQVLLAIRQIHTPVLDQVAIALSLIGQPQVLLMVCVGLGIWLWLKRRYAEAVTLGITAVGAAGLNFVLKDLFARARPELWQRIVDVRYYSFPSGHAMLSMVIYSFVGYLLITQLHWSRFWVISVLALLIGAIGFSRLYLGVHWLTDVISGYAAGLVWVITCILGLQVWQRFRAEKSTRRKF